MERTAGAKTREPWQQSEGLGGALLLLPLAVVSATVASWLYVSITGWLPLVGNFTALLAVGLGLATIAPIMLAAPLLSVRSVKVMRLVGVFAGVAAMWMAWAWFAWRITDGAKNVLEWAASPADLAALARAVADAGSVSIGAGRGVTPKGDVLWLLWVLEAVLVIAPCVVVAPRTIVHRPWCERCSGWMPLRHHVPFVTAATARAVKEIGPAAIVDAARPKPDAATCWVLVSWHCPSCAAGVFRIDRALGFTANDLLSPTWSPRARTSFEPIMRMTRATAADATAIERIAGETQFRMA